MGTAILLVFAVMAGVGDVGAHWELDAPIRAIRKEAIRVGMLLVERMGEVGFDAPSLSRGSEGCDSAAFGLVRRREARQQTSLGGGQVHTRTHGLHLR